MRAPARSCSGCVQMWRLCADVAGPASCAHLSKQGSPEEQLPKHRPTSISCSDLQNKGMNIPGSPLRGPPGSRCLSPG